MSILLSTSLDVANQDKGRAILDREEEMRDFQTVLRNDGGDAVIRCP